MINTINNFFNDNPIIAILLICILLLALYNNLNKSSEHMEDIPKILPKCTVNDDQLFFSQYATTNGTILNFKCNIKGVDHYLACVKMSEQKELIDCAQSMLVLIPAVEMQTMLDNYLNDIKTAEKICNSSLKIKCEQTVQSSESGSICSDTYDSCKQPRFFLHDFNIINVNPTDDHTILRKYIIKGTAIPLMNGHKLPTMFNTFLFNEHGINMVCGDTYQYGAPNIPKQYAEIIINEKINDQTGGQTLKIKIKFDALQQLISDKKRIPIFDQCSGEHKTKPTYLGVCEGHSGQYQRVCVYENIMDPNILEFTPTIVNI